MYLVPSSDPSPWRAGAVDEDQGPPSQRAWSKPVQPASLSVGVAHFTSETFFIFLPIDFVVGGHQLYLSLTGSPSSTLLSTLHLMIGRSVDLYE